MSFKLRQQPISSPSCDQENHPLPPGVVLSPQNAHPITSWGLRPMDVALGGGLPLSSLVVVAEDSPTTYHIPFLSYVTAQGLRHGHAVAVASLCSSADLIVNNLPACVSQDSPENPTHTMSSVRVPAAPDMKIAWRYRNSGATQPFHTSSKSHLRSFTADFDLSEHDEIPKNAALSSIPVDLNRQPLKTLLTNISQHFQKASQLRLLSRVIIHGLSTALLSDTPDSDLSLTQFLAQLRALISVYGAVGVVSCAADVPYPIMRTSGDAFVAIDSFSGRGAGVAGLGSEWLGVIIVKKTFRLGCRSLAGRGDVWVFKRGRRKYTMERATAAPEEAENNLTASESTASQGDSSVTSALCAPGPSATKYEF